MLRTVHTSLPARVLAALVALGLSGVPALTSEHATGGHAAGHRCRCPRGQHDCACPACRSAARAARRAGVAALPPCHRARALEALAREDAEPAQGRSGAAPCLRSACDGPGERLPTPTAQELFVLPSRALRTSRGWMARLRATAGTGRERARAPETPPPRRA